MLTKPTRGIQLNRSHPLSRGLVACWLFNEGCGDLLFDSSGNAINCDDFVSSPQWRPGKFGSCLLFDGSNYVKKTISNFRGDDSKGTFAAWIYPTTIDGFHTIFSSSQQTSLNNYIILRLRSSAVINFTQRNGTGDVLTSINGDTALSLNNWHHVVYMSDGDSFAMYVDGKLQSLTVAAGYDDGHWFADTSNRENIAFGILHRTGAEAYYYGKIDHALLYDRSLSASEVKLLCHEPFCFCESIPIRVFRIAQFVAMSASIAGVGGAVADSKRVRGIGSELSGTGAVSAVARAARALETIIEAAGGLDGDLSITTAVYMAAEIAASGDIAAAAMVDRKIAAVFSAAGDLTALLTAYNSIAALIESAGTLTAALDASKKLTAEIAATGDLSGSLFIAGTIYMSAVIAGVGGVVADLKLSQKLSSAISAAGELAAVISADRKIASAISAAGDLSANIKRDRGLVCEIASAGDLAGLLKKSLTFAAAISAGGDLSADMTAYNSIAAQIEASGDLSGNLFIEAIIEAEAEIAGAGSITGTLTGIGGIRTRVLGPAGGSTTTGKNVSRPRIVT